MKRHVNKKDMIYQQLKERIVSGDLTPKSRLPKELDFAKALGVGRVTLRSALDRLLDENLVQRIPGKGTFVASASEICPRRYLAITPPQSESFESPMSHIMPALEQRVVEKAVKLQKYSVDFFRSMEVSEGLERIKEGGYNGIFYMANNVNGDEREFHIVKKTGLPVIMPHATHSDYKITGFAVMQTDQKESFSAAVKSLAAKGHQRIGTIFLYGRINREFSSEEYEAFLRRTDVDSSRELVQYCSYNFEAAFSAVENLMRLPKPPTAIMCTSDFVALYVYRALRKMRVQIPQQVAVMGYCGYPGGELLSPSLSTVNLYFEKTGRDALDMMLDAEKWWKPGIAPPNIYTPYKVIERGSTDIKRVEKELAELLCS
jgi:DNA-binding LacI/PurR family transcriptional regulator